MSLLFKADQVLTATGTLSVGDLGVMAGVSTAVVHVVQTSSTGVLEFRGYIPGARANAADGGSGIVSTDYVKLAYTIASTGVLTSSVSAIATGVAAEIYFVRCDGLWLDIVWTRTGGTLKIAVSYAKG